MAVQVRHALSKQVRKENMNKIHSFPNNQQSMHDSEFLHTVTKMSSCMQYDYFWSWSIGQYQMHGKPIIFLT